MSTEQVIIAGGGIGGLGAALMLSRRGVRVRVLERAPDFAEVGAGLQLAPNITRMLDEVGVLEKILPLSVLPRRLVFRNAVTEPNVTLHTDHRVTDVEDRGDHVIVRCANGAEYTGQLLVGADGLHSTVRKRIVSDDMVCSGYVAYRGAVPLDAVDRRVSLDDVVVWMGPGLHLVQYPVRAGEFYNQVAVFRSQEYLEGKKDWGTPEELDRTYSRMCEAVRVAIPSLQRNNRWPMYDRDPIPSWTKCRITLLGDAAHPMLQYLAQGAGQALLDGAALATSLSGLGNDPWPGERLAAALGDYERARVEFAGRVQSTARVWGDIWHVDTYVATLLRDEVFRSRDIHDYHLVDWLYGPVRESEPDRATTPETAAFSSVHA